MGQIASSVGVGVGVGVGIVLAVVVGLVGTGALVVGGMLFGDARQVVAA